MLSGTPPEARSELDNILTAAFGLCRIGVAGTANVQGEDQKKLDILSNDIMINSLRASGKCAVLVSEENEDPIIIDAGHRGRYCVVFDPLDGSSNIDAGVNIGTIFGVYKCVRSHFAVPGGAQVSPRGQLMCPDVQPVLTCLDTHRRTTRRVRSRMCCARALNSRSPVTACTVPRPTWSSRPDRASTATPSTT